MKEQLNSRRTRKTVQAPNCVHAEIIPKHKQFKVKIVVEGGTNGRSVVKNNEQSWLIDGT
jgi:hypothetical protein